MHGLRAVVVASAAAADGRPVSLRPVTATNGRRRAGAGGKLIVTRNPSLFLRGCYV
jgi:hypothetical protein